MTNATKKKPRTAKVGHHRGNPRLWFEGAWLLEAGFTPGYAFDCRGRDGKLVLVAGEGVRTISQKKGKPVLDICNSIVTEILGDCERVNVVVGKGRLTITPA